MMYECPNGHRKDLYVHCSRMRAAFPQWKNCPKCGSEMRRLAINDAPNREESPELIKKSKWNLFEDFKIIRDHMFAGFEISEQTIQPLPMPFSNIWFLNNEGNIEDP